MRRALGATGRVFITVGILLLLFVAYQLWGTGIYQARAQDDLRGQFQRSLRHAATTTTVPPSTATPSTTTTTVPPPPSIPPAGAALGILTIPKIGVTQFVVEGVGVADLRKGPGHYPSTPLPGHAGNSAIAGHRTTYGAPFGDLDQLDNGDELSVRTVEGTFPYKVFLKEAVTPDKTEVLDAIEGHPATLTLTTCNPKYSASERLIVQADLDLPPDQPPLPINPAPPGARKASLSLSGDTSSRLPALIWGLIAAAVGAMWWLVFHRYPRWTTWFPGLIPFLAVLFVFYTYVERLLPSNY